MITKIIGFLLITLLAGCASTPKVETVPAPQFDGVNQATQARVQAWKELIDEGASWSDAKKLLSVNDFINEIRFVDDIVHWGKNEYWATPLQTLVTNAGDCEDLSIAKFFTLSAMGVEQRKLRLTYVKALSINKPHMVVSYFASPGVEPLVLDNLNQDILPASQRSDLIPVYSFNGVGLWTTKSGRNNQYIGSSGRMSLWQGLLTHMDVEAANESAMICLYQYYDLPELTAKMHCP